MGIDINTNPLYDWRSLDEIIPYEQYKSGNEDRDKPVYKYPADSTSNPILSLEIDILNKDGFGLKRGYYELGTDENLSCLMFIESGRIKAKIPVIKQEVISKAGSDFEWQENKSKNTPKSSSKNPEDEIKISSRKTYKQPFTDKELKKRKKKYQKGQDPLTYFHSKAYMEYNRELDAYMVIWEKYNTRLIGIIKI